MITAFPPQTLLQNQPKKPTVSTELWRKLNDDVLFGEVWIRQKELSLHNRSIVTVLSLVAQGLTDSSFEKKHSNEWLEKVDAEHYNKLK